MIRSLHDSLVELVHTLTWMALNKVFLLLIVKITAVYILLITPVMFNYFIIPIIEKRLGKSLKYHGYIQYDLFGYFFFRSVEVYTYIFISYINLKLRFKTKTKYKESALSKADYDIKTASKVEIFSSVCSFCSLILCCVASLILYVSNH